MASRTADPRPAGDDRVADLVQAALPDLTGAELKVARRLLNHEPTVGLRSLAELAEVAGVSGPTVTRFVKKLGFDDYAAFQRTLRFDLDARLVSPVDTLLKAPSSPQGLGAYGERMAQLVQSTMSAVSEYEFESSCKLLANAKVPVLTAGGWNTVVAAHHLASQLQQVRSAVVPVTEPFTSVAASIADRGPRPTAVIFDLRRYEQRMISLARILSEQGSKVILVTDTWTSPASHYADFVLPVTVEAGHAFDSVLGAVAIAEAVAHRTTQLLGDVARDRAQVYNAFTMAVSPRWEPDQ